MGLDATSPPRRQRPGGKASTLHRSSPLAGYASPNISRAAFSRTAPRVEYEVGTQSGPRASGTRPSVSRGQFSHHHASGPGSQASSTYYQSTAGFTSKQYDVDYSQDVDEDEMNATLAEDALAESTDPNMRLMLERLRAMSQRHQDLAQQFTNYRSQADMVVRTLRQKLDDEQALRVQTERNAHEKVEQYKAEHALKSRELVVMETKLNEMSIARKRFEEKLMTYRSEHAAHVQAVEEDAQRAREGATTASAKLTRREGRESELQAVLDFMKAEHEKDLESVLLELQEIKHHNTKLAKQLASHRCESLNVRVLEQATLLTALTQMTDASDFSPDMIRSSLLRVKAAVTKRCNDLEAELIGEKARLKEYSASVLSDDQGDSRWESEDAPVFFSHRVKELESSLHEARAQIAETEAHLTDTFLAAKEEWRRRASEYERQIDLLDEQMRQMPLEARFGSAVSGDASDRERTSAVIMGTPEQDTATTVRRLATALDVSENKVVRLEGLVAHMEDELRDTKVKCSEFELLCQRREEEYTALAQEKAVTDAEYANATATREAATLEVEDGRSRMLDEAEEQEDLIQALQTRVDDLTHVQEQSMMSNDGQEEMDGLHGAIPADEGDTGARANDDAEPVAAIPQDDDGAAATPADDAVEPASDDASAAPPPPPPAAAPPAE